MISAGDIITTNYCDRWPKTWRVVEVRHDCQCGRYSVWPSRLIPGRQRLPHLHIAARNESGGYSYWNRVIERDGRLIETGRMWVRPGDSEIYQHIHPEILIVSRAKQGSLF